MIPSCSRSWFLHVSPMKPLCNPNSSRRAAARRFLLCGKRLVIGRRESCDICLKFPNISGRHCELTLKDGVWLITDLGSTNGIRINGVRLAARARKLLHTGDVITIGKRNYILHYEEAARQRIGELMEDFEEEDVMSIPLLERAGLQKPGADGKRDFRFDEEEEEED
ncbi:MAG: FHA domain-containing protein [Gemmataceae bacterium]